MPPSLGSPGSVEKQEKLWDIIFKDSTCELFCFASALIFKNNSREFTLEVNRLLKVPLIITSCVRKPPPS